LAETEKLVNSINPDIQILSIPLDITDMAGVTKAFEAITARFGAPHVLINNAGYINPLDSIADVDVDLWWRAQVRLFFGSGRVMIHPDSVLSQ
jgi:NAD(P)-dependent dehydrogenase (short-subunit alcohol dehydrogenase family)